jgi:hypothetical protein
LQNFQPTLSFHGGPSGSSPMENVNVDEKLIAGGGNTPSFSDFVPVVATVRARFGPLIRFAEDIDNGEFPETHDH